MKNLLLPPATHRIFKTGLLMLLWASHIQAQEKPLRPYREVFALWNESVKKQIYAHLSVIRGDQKLLEELQRRAPDNMPFLRAQAPNYFFFPIDRSSFGDSEADAASALKSQEKYVPIAWCTDPDEKSQYSARAGGLMLFHNIRALWDVSASSWDNSSSMTLSVRQSNAAKARALIKEAIERGEFHILLLPDAEPKP